MLFEKELQNEEEQYQQGPLQWWAWVIARACQQPQSRSSRRGRRRSRPPPPPSPGPAPPTCGPCTAGDTQFEVPPSLQVVLRSSSRLVLCRQSPSLPGTNELISGGEEHQMASNTELINIAIITIIIINHISSSSELVFTPKPLAGIFPTNLAEFFLSRLVDNEHEGPFDALGSPWQDIASPAVADIDLLPVFIVTAVLHNRLTTSQLHHLFHHSVVKHSQQQWILCQGSSHLTYDNDVIIIDIYDTYGL